MDKNNNVLLSAALLDDTNADIFIDKLSSENISPDSFSEDDEKQLVDEENIEDYIDNEEGFSDGNEIDALKLYLRDVSEIVKTTKLLSAEKEKELAKKAHDGDRKALEEIIHANLRLVIRYAFKHKNKGVPVLDLIQEGNLGLLVAVERFDENKNYRFSTYSTWWILQRIKKAIIEKESDIRIPPHMVYKIRKIGNIVSDFKEKYNRMPTVKELVVESGFSEKTIKNILRVPKITISLETKIDEDSNSTWGEVVSDESSLSLPEICEKNHNAQIINNQINLSLTEKEKIVIHKYYYEHKSLEQIGRELGGLTRARVGQIKNKAIVKLQDADFDDLIFDDDF